MRIVVVGGTGPIGSRLITMLGSCGHEVVAASLEPKVNPLTGDGLADALRGAAVVVDVSHSPSLDDEAATQTITTRMRALLEHEVDAGVTHHVALSSVGAELLAESAYFRARCAEEQMIKGSPLPHSIVRATPLFESLGTLGDMAAHGAAVRVPPVLVQPVAADDVVQLVAALAMGAPLNGTVEVGGPEPFYLDGLVQRVLGARNDPRPVVGDIHARYYGARLEERALMAGDEAELGEIRFDDWLARPEVHAPGTSAIVAPERVLQANEFRIGEVTPGSVLLMGDVAVFSVAGGFCATQAVCPHRAGPLSEGVIDDTTVTCPLHGASFNIWTGAVLRGPAEHPLLTYQVTVVGDIGRVEVDHCSVEGSRMRPPSECRSLPNVDHLSLARYGHPVPHPQ